MTDEQKEVNKRAQINKRQKILNYITNIFLAISLITLLSTTLFAIFLADEEVTFLGYKPYIISSNSMSPSYMQYDVVIIKSGNFEKVENNEVIAFKARPLGGDPAFHRVVQLSEAGLLTKGDANVGADANLVTKKNFIGREVFHITFLRKIIPMLRTPKGILIVLVLPIVIIVIFIILLSQLKQYYLMKQLESTPSETDEKVDD